jgi:aryl-alcohol dehydrogenase-like predicted oxidoreductase
MIWFGISIVVRLLLDLVHLHTAATQFPLRHPAVTTIIVGFQQPSEVQACLDALHQPIPDAFWSHFTPVDF